MMDRRGFVASLLAVAGIFGWRLDPGVTGTVWSATKTRLDPLYVGMTYYGDLKPIDRRLYGQKATVSEIDYEHAEITMDTPSDWVSP